jgi:uncharacterized protein YbjT (DUF2867 family)
MRIVVTGATGLLGNNIASCRHAAGGMKLSPLARSATDLYPCRACP